MKEKTERKREEKTVKIRIWGIVQGVGFRPFVAKLADRMQMKGEVLNIGGLVDVTVTDTEERIGAFVQALKKEKPEPAEIVHMKETPLPYQEFGEFSILQSDYGDEEAAMIPADLAICPDCLKELYDVTNPRYHHPFISCMICGPRYTIIDSIPYDRENTTMDEFPMCTFCHGQYTDRQDRRYHAQTISCHECGPVIKYRLKSKEGACGEGFSTVPIFIAASLIEKGGIIALKGVGGYNFLCDPFNEKAVTNLRRLKHRVRKPFAVMFPNMKKIKEQCYVNAEEEALLTSSPRPIVLLQERKDKKGASICKGVCSDSGAMGVFLPSMGMQYLLLDRTGPVIATSGNVSGMPMITEDEEMLRLLEVQPLLEGVFYNERKIRIPVDDSVVRVIDGQPQMIRRAKGYAPVPLYLDVGRQREQARQKGTQGDIKQADQKEKQDRQLLAVGGQLKSSFALSKGPFAYVSQYFGDLDSKEACEIYEKNVERLQNLFRIRPGLLVCDKHPLYHTTKFAKDYGESHGNLPILSVQHHHAHVASVMAENKLDGQVIGVAFDGTGYGDDGKIWGGEIFLCQEASYVRKAHLEYVKMIGGDGSMKEGWKSAMCYVHHWKQRKKTGFPGEFSVDLTEILAYGEKNMTDHGNWPMVSAALSGNINVIESSSMGRLFDGVAALLQIQPENTYEGECAIMLEKAAAAAIENPGKKEKNDLALKFHYGVAQVILEQCQKIRGQVLDETGQTVTQVALTGGVFQNKILMEKSLQLLRDDGFQVYYNISVSPNDGGIALGQLYVGMHRPF